MLLAFEANCPEAGTLGTFAGRELVAVAVAGLNFGVGFGGQQGRHSAVLAFIGCIVQHCRTIQSLHTHNLFPCTNCMHGLCLHLHQISAIPPKRS